MSEKVGLGADSCQWCADNCQAGPMQYRPQLSDSEAGVALALK